MDWVFIIIAATTLFIGGISLYLYQKKYEARVNEALLHGHTKKMKSTLTVLLIGLISFTLFVITFNFLPVLDEHDIDLENRIQEDVMTTTTKDYNNNIFKIYDFKFVDGGYVVSYSNDQMWCGWNASDICTDDAYLNSSSQISFYDESGIEQWQLGGYYAVDINIEYDHYQFDARSVDRLNDGSFVSIGKYVDLDTEEYGVALLEIDSFGTMTDLVVLDEDDYNLPEYSSHQYYEIRSTNDGGFVIKITDYYDIGIVIKFDSDFEAEWNYIPEGFPFYDDYFVTMLLYQDDMVFVLERNSVVALDETGAIAWVYSEDEFQLMSMKLYDGQLYLMGESLTEFLRQDTLFQQDEHINIATKIIVDAIDITDGSIVSSFTFAYNDVYLGYEDLHIDPRDVFQDDEGNTYILCVDTRITLDDLYVLYIIKYDAQNKYQGLAVFSGNYGYNDSNYYHTAYMNYRTDIVFENGLIDFYTPTFSIHRTVDFTSLIFYTDIDDHFSPEFISTIIYLRVLFNKLLVTTYVALLISFVLIQLRRERKIEQWKKYEFDEQEQWKRKE